MTPEEQNAHTISLRSTHLGSIVDQLEDLVKLSLECEKKDINQNISFVQVITQLTQLKQVLEEFHLSYMEALKKLEVPPQDTKQLKETFENLKTPEKNLLLKLQRLEKECEDARGRMYASLQQNQEAAKDLKAELKSKKGRRKEKFKSVGGKKGWMKT